MKHTERPFYANGTLEYDLDKRSLESLEKDGDAILLPVTSPYLIVSAKVTGRSANRAKIQFLPLLKSAPSRQWKTLWEGKGEFALHLDELVNTHAMFGYVLKVSDSVEELRIVSDLQFPPRSIPYLDPGVNRFYWYSEEENPVFRISDFLSHAGIVTVCIGTQETNGHGVRVTFNCRANLGYRRTGEYLGRGNVTE